MTDTQKKQFGPAPMEGLTPAQQKLLDAVKKFIAAHDMPPNVSELAEILNIKPPSVHAQITAMVEKGVLRRTPYKGRLLEIINDNPTVMSLVPVPIVGDVAAGKPIMAEENRIGEVLVESHIARGSCFALRVKGDSMVDAGIDDGSMVIVRLQPVAESGDIIVALLRDQEATVKRLFIAGEIIELRPANQAYQPIRIKQDDDFRIFGKVMAVRSVLPSVSD
ncbi:MAG: repressor LexA [Magnetococcales bacterium]|nr:repressor LexA [Magnetococcales bacterium]